MPELIHEFGGGGKQNVIFEQWQSSNNAIYYKERDLETNVSKRIGVDALIGSFNQTEKKGRKWVETNEPLAPAPSEYSRFSTPLTILDREDVRRVMDKKDQAHAEELRQRDEAHAVELTAKDEQRVADMDALRAEVAQQIADALETQRLAHRAELEQQKLAAETERIALKQQLQQAEVDGIRKARQAADAAREAARVREERLQEQITQLQAAQQQPTQRGRRFGILRRGNNNNNQPQQIQLETDALEAHNPADMTPFNTARDEYVRTIDRRKARGVLNKYFRRGESQERIDAMHAYSAQLDEVLRHREEQGLANGSTQDEVDGAQHAFIFNQRIELARAGRALSDQRYQDLINDNDASGLRKGWAKMVHGYANLGTGWKIATGGTASIVVLGISSVLGFGVAALAAGTTIKMSLGYLRKQANIRNVPEKRLRAEENRIQKRTQEERNEALTGDTAARRAALVERFNLGERSEARRQAVVNTIGNVAIFGAVGMAGMSAANHFIDGDIPKPSFPRIRNFLGGIKDRVTSMDVPGIDNPLDNDNNGPSNPDDSSNPDNSSTPEDTTPTPDSNPGSGGGGSISQEQAALMGGVSNPYHLEEHPDTLLVNANHGVDPNSHIAFFPDHHGGTYDNTAARLPNGMDFHDGGANNVDIVDSHGNTIFDNVQMTADGRMRAKMLHDHFVANSGYKYDLGPQGHLFYQNNSLSPWRDGQGVVKHVVSNLEINSLENEDDLSQSG